MCWRRRRWPPRSRRILLRSRSRWALILVLRRWPRARARSRKPLVDAQPLRALATEGEQVALAGGLLWAAPAEACVALRVRVRRAAVRPARRVPTRNRRVAMQWCRALLERLRL